MCQPRELGVVKRETAAYSSWYSSAEIHIFLNVLRPARIEPPIQVEYLRSGGAEMRIFVSRSASFLTSCNSRSPKPVRECERLYSLARERRGRTLGEGRAAREDNVAKERLAQVEVGLVDRIHDDVVHAAVLEPNNVWIEQELGRTMPFRSKLLHLIVSVVASAHEEGDARG